MEDFSRKWPQSGHYEWLSGYLHARGWSAITRALLAWLPAMLAVAVLVVLASSDGVKATVPVAMACVSALGGLACAAGWAWRWPSHPQSAVIAVTLNGSIALSALANSSPMLSMVSCAGFTSCGLYIAVFHGTRLIVYNAVVATAISGFEAAQLAANGRVMLGAAFVFWGIHFNLAVPIVVQRLVRALGADLVGADRDPLTGLLNRRAFQHNAMGLLVARNSLNDHLLIALIDLDSFKALNDSRGHSAGDRALVDVARALRANTRDSAVIGRSGGEEFLIADTLSTNDPLPMSRRIRDAVAALPVGVTASVGTAMASLSGVHNNALPQLIEDLVAAADSAMYQAKRSGGNAFHHYDSMEGVISKP